MKISNDIVCNLNWIEFRFNSIEKNEIQIHSIDIENLLINTVLKTHIQKDTFSSLLFENGLNKFQFEIVLVMNITYET
jgi:hypothetical protein